MSTHKHSPFTFAKHETCKREACYRHDSKDASSRAQPISGEHVEGVWGRLLKLPTFAERVETDPGDGVEAWRHLFRERGCVYLCLTICLINI